LVVLPVITKGEGLTAGGGAPGIRAALSVCRARRRRLTYYATRIGMGEKFSDGEPSGAVAGAHPLPGGLSRQAGRRLGGRGWTNGAIRCGFHACTSEELQ